MGATTAAGWLTHTLAGGGLLLLLGWAWAATTRQPVRRLRVAQWSAAAALVLAALSVGPAWLVITTPAPRADASAARPAEAPRPPPQANPNPAPTAPPPAATIRDPLPPLAFNPPAAPAPDRTAVPPQSRRNAEAPPQQQGKAAPPHGTETSPQRGATAALPAGRGPETTPQQGWGPAWSWDRVASVAAGVYLAAATVLLARWLLGWVGLRRLVRRCEPASGRAARIFAELTEGRLRPRLLASRHARAPFSCGLLRPAVVLPAGLCEAATDEVLRWVLVHELAHLERRDAWSGLLFALAQAVYFPVPWFWRLRRQARLCQEYLADAAAAAAGGRAEDYAQFLLAWAAAPRPPAGACGVGGPSSDLYWRVKTMLQSPAPLERRCPRRWSLAAACGLLSLAVLAAGVTLKAAAAPAPDVRTEEPKKDQPKPDQPKPDQPKPDQPKADAPDKQPAAPDVPLPDIDQILKNMPNVTPEMAQRYRAMMQQQREMMRKMMEQQRANGFGNPFGQGFPNFPGFGPQDARLGVTVERPTDALVDQLELPKDQGLVIRDVTADSPAAKAGIKANDILLELNGKPVTSDPDELRKMVEDVKADKPVDAVVMRKGKKETIKGISMPEAKAPAFPGINPGFPQNPNPVPFPPPNFPNIPNLPAVPPGLQIDGQAFVGGNGVMTTMFRSNDHFTTRHQEGSLAITLTGKVEDGKPKVGEIIVKDGNESNKYQNVDKVPEQYRDKVKNLVEMSEKGSVKIDVKAP
jgi:beta-lactamase regulating signal transducer with metallopeptidase domain